MIKQRIHSFIWGETIYAHLHSVPEKLFKIMTGVTKVWKSLIMLIRQHLIVNKIDQIGHPQSWACMV